MYWLPFILMALYHPLEVKHNVILITLDGVRWQEILNGTDEKYSKSHLSARDIAPNIYNHFVDNGITYTNAYASGPVYLSLPGYLEMVRGYSTNDCFSNICNLYATGTFTDFIHENGDTVGIFSSWDVIKKVSGSYRDQIVVDAGRFYKSSGVKDIDYNYEWIGDASYRPDAYTEVAATRFLLNNSPNFLWISLGDTDEWAHKGNYTRYISAISSADAFIGQLFSLIDTSKTVVIMTTDHGRGKDFKNHYKDEWSRRVWIMASGGDIPAKGFDERDDVSLSDIFPMVLGAMYVE